MNNNTLKSGTLLRSKSYTYTIQKVLGQGTFGITYLATTQVKITGALGEIDTTIQVAIKEFFMSDINGREDNTVTSGSKGGVYDKYKQKFAREAENLSKLHHPYIVKVLEYFEANNTIYYAMEFVEGGNLNEYIEKKNGLPETECVKYAKQIGIALSYMHAHKMLHLDLKPGNVMLRKNGDAVLIDFGLSKQYDENGNPETSTTVGGGTPGYAPIEQANYHEGKGFPVTMDVYALGATMYKMLTGVRPPEAVEILNEGFPAYQLQEHQVSDFLIACVAKAMSTLKKDRQQSVEEFLRNLDNKKEDIILLEEETEVITSDTEKQTDTDIVQPSTFQKNRKVILSLALFIVLVIGGIIIGYMTSKSGPTTYENKTFAETIKAAEAGDTKAQFEIGEMYYYGNRGVSQDNSMAMLWYQKAAEQGNADAQCMIGRMYALGFGVPQNISEAHKWYKKAAENGNTKASRYLAEYYYNENIHESIKWYKKAAELGDAEAQYQLGYIYEWGKGVYQNKEEAMKWYRKAAEQGHIHAKEALQSLEKKQT